VTTALRSSLRYSLGRAHLARLCRGVQVAAGEQCLRRVGRPYVEGSSDHRLAVGQDPRYVASGHAIHSAEPKLVIGEIQRVLENVR
jgi:hypothetical protein